jgi:hypothetical protein
MIDIDSIPARTPTAPWRREGFTVRKMMAAVAVVAVLCGGVVEGPRLWNRRQTYLGFAEKYGYWETRLNGVVALRQEITYYSIRLPRGPEPSAERLARMKAEAAYFGRLRAKYEHAARFPWLPVAPDPPRP